jgi:Family of unknown function (DUF5678)
MKALKAKVLDGTHLELSQPLPEVPGGRIEIQIAQPSSAGQALKGRRLREREDAWLRSHPDVFRSYAGQWLVVEGEQVVAHGKDPARLVKDARARGVRIPYVFYVEPPRPGVVRLGM